MLLSKSSPPLLVSSIPVSKDVRENAITTVLSHSRKNASNRSEWLIVRPLVFLHLPRVETGSFDRLKNDVSNIILRSCECGPNANEHLLLQTSPQYQTASKVISNNG